ncbi:MAG: PAS domain-containing sensor histidine kinase, partial [Clostridiaceae bacterium]
MKHAFKWFNKKSILYSKNNIVTKVNTEFINLCGYSKTELVGKSLTEVSNMLRMDSQVYLQNAEHQHSCYIFTKKLEAREIDILCKSLQSDNEKIYSFIEKPNSRIEKKFIYLDELYKNDEAGVAVYSFPDLILLKANEKHSDCYQYNEKENAIGKNLKQILTQYQCRDVERNLLNIMETGNSYHIKEFEYEHSERGITYWDIKIVPIQMEGEAKYLIQIICDVTEIVLNRKLIEKQAEVIESQEEELEAISAQKEELEAVLENSSDGIYTVDKDFSITFLNSSIKEFAYKPESLKKFGDTLKHTEYYDSEGNLLDLEDFQECRILKGEKIKDDRRTCHRPDGIYHISISGGPVYDKSGNISKAVICLRDVTEQVNKSEVIRQQKQQMEAILENISDDLGICDKNGQYLMINKAFRNNPLYGFTGSIIPENVYELAEHYDIDGEPLLIQDFPSKRVARGEKFSGYRIKIKKGNTIAYKEISGTPIYDDKGSFIAGIIVSHDITERLKNEENLLIKTQYEVLSNVIENFDFGCTRVSFPDLKIKYINAKGYEHLIQENYNGGKPVSVIGKNIFDTFQCSAEQRLLSKNGIQNLIHNKARSFHLYKKVIMAGEERFFRVIYQPLFGLNNQITELIRISIDVTEEVRAKNKMEEALKAQDEIFSNISHELKTPLNVIFSTNQLMELYLKNDSLESNKEKIAKGIDVIKQNCYRFIKLINNIVDLSKIDSGFFTLNLSNENIVNITEDIVQSVADYIKGKGLNIIFDTNTEEKIIDCDPDKIERIILNLISNAIKFTNPGGSIFVNLIDKGDTVEISVEDTGIGMDK